MKKILGSAALLAGCVSAHGQSNLEVYGVIDAAITVANATGGTKLPGGAGGAAPGAGTVTRMDSSVGPGGTRLGFRGGEDLGDGLRAKFALESGFALDSGALQQGGLLFGRQAYVGVASKNWSLTAGRQYTPINLSIAFSEAAGGYYWGNADTTSGFSLYESVGAVPGGGSYQASARMDNSILLTNSFGKITTNLMIGLGNENTRRTGRYFNPDISYVDGPFALRLSYAQLHQNVEAITATADPEWLRQFVVGGSYDFGVAKIFAGFYGFNGAQNAANRSPAATLGSPTASPFAYNWKKSRSAWLGARIPLAGGTLIPWVLQNRFDYGDAPDGRTTVTALAYEYPFSKRTLFYASFANLKNDDRVNTPVVSTVIPVLASGFGSDIRVASFGIRHSF
jgi:predicted porin